MQRALSNRAGLRTRLLSTALGCGLLALHPAAFAQSSDTLAASSGLSDAPQAVAVETDDTVDIVVDAPLVTNEDGTPAILGRSFLGDVAINNLDVTTQGFASDGIFAQVFDNDASILIYSGDVATEGPASRGIVVRHDGMFGDGLTQVFSGNVTTAGADSVGIDVVTNGSLITLESGSVTTTGDFAHGIVARSGNEIQLVSDHVSTAGLGAIGIQAEATSFVTVDSVEVETQGDGAHGIVADSGFSAYVRSETVRTNGTEAHGIIVQGLDKLAYAESGSVVTSGDGSVGILARSTGSVTVSSGSVVTTGASLVTDGGGDGPPGDGGGDGFPPDDGGGDGFPPDGGGGDPFPPSGPVGTVPAAPTGAAMGIVAISEAADVYVESGYVSTAGAGATGIYATANTDTIVISDEIETAGESAFGILARSSFGDVGIDSGAVSTQGDFASAISADSQFGNVLVLSEAVSTTGFDACGITANADKDIVIESGSVETEGDASTGIRAFTFTGEVDILSGAISTQGSDADGISVIGLGGGSDVRIESGSISTLGDGSDGIFVDTFGEVLVQADTITTAGSNAAGIFVDATDDVHVQANHVATQGVASAAISVGTEGGDITIEAGSVSSQGASSAGIEGFAEQGDVTITVNQVNVSGDRFEPDGGGDGGGLPGTPDPGGPASTEPGFNVIGVAATTVEGNIVVNAGEVSAAGQNTNGISVFATLGTADVTVNSVDVDGYGGVVGARVRGDLGASLEADEIVVRSARESEGDTDPFSDAVSVGSIVGEASARVNSVHAEGLKMTDVEMITLYGSIYTEVGDVTVTGEGGGGIRALSSSVAEDGGHTTILANSVTTVGDYITGVRSIAMRSSNEIRVGEVSTTGRQSVGIFSASRAGAEIEVGSVTTTGDAADGIQAINRRGLNGSEGPLIRNPDEFIGGGGDGPTDPDGDPAGDPNGNFAALLLAAGDLGLSAEDILPGTVPDGDISITAGSVSTSGDSSRGIAAHANGDVVIESGSVVTTGESTRFFIATRFENGQTVDGFWEIDGPASYGIDAISDYGSVTIASGSVSTLGGGAHGIRARTAEGAIDVTAGDVVVSGLGADGLNLVSVSGDVSALINGHVRAEQGVGIRIATAGAVDVEIADGGLVESAGDGFAIVIEPGLVPDDPIIPDDPDGSFPDSLSASNLGTTYTPVTSGSSLTVAQGGTLQGRIQLTDGDDTVSIAGRFLASGTSVFGGGTDTLVNTGEVFIVDGAAGFDGLESFQNQGLLSLADGDAGDTIDFSGISFVGGTGSVLAFDVLDNGAGGVTADSITFGDVSGSTEIRVAAETGLTLDTTVGLINFTTPVAADAFTISADTADAGFMQWTLVQSGTALTLAANPDAEVFELAQAGGVATDVWHVGTQSIRQQSALLRSVQEIQGDGMRGWLDVYSGSRNGADVELSTRHAGGTVSQTLARDLDASGVSGGLAWQRDALNMGLALGYADASARFTGTGNTMALETVSFAGFAGWQSGAYSVSGVAKLDTGPLEIDVASAGERGEVDVTTLGLNGEAGARFQSGETWFEPAVSVSWVSASLGQVDFNTGGFDLADGDSLQAEIGARAGHAFSAGRWTVRPTAGLFLVEEFAGENEAVYVSGSSQLDLVDEPAGSYGRLELGASFELDTGLVLNVAGEAFDGDQSGGSIRLGGLFRF